ncbi:bacteriophage protein [Burkholderia cepacia]|uniref:Bacteriophage protein n=1 Tax=Burkholderia cepacia TaxID=292 RepID=A0AAE8N8S2_BURCE|nr:hypothetical protein [Burkholderia cepacia]POM13914.1 hypothetical protein CSX04_08390 [Burkholderia cepacia]SPV11626.1 bacteriophage protein [Burkholderia cepacia]
MGFKFKLGDDITIEASGETGVVVGRAEYSNVEDAYLVRYKAGDGRATESWWSESALTT